MMRPSKDEADPVPAGELTYAEATTELDEIVAFFEHGDLDVDQLVGRLERATAIVDELDRRLRTTRTQVEALVPRLESAVSSTGRDDTPGPDEPPEFFDDPVEDPVDDPVDKRDAPGLF